MRLIEVDRQSLSTCREYKIYIYIYHVNAKSLKIRRIACTFSCFVILKQKKCYINALSIFLLSQRIKEKKRNKNSESLWSAYVELAKNLCFYNYLLLKTITSRISYLVNKKNIFIFVLNYRNSTLYITQIFIHILGNFLGNLYNF